MCQIDNRQAVQPSYWLLDVFTYQIIRKASEKKNKKWRKLGHVRLVQQNKWELMHKLQETYRGMNAPQWLTLIYNGVNTNWDNSFTCENPWLFIPLPSIYQHVGSFDLFVNKQRRNRDHQTHDRLRGVGEKFFFFLLSHKSFVFPPPYFI